MARVQDVFGSQGIAAGSPFALGFFPYVANVNPATLATSPLMDYTTGTGGTHPGIIIAVAGVDPQPAASEFLRIKGGAIIEGAGADTVVVGRGAGATLQDAVVLGRAASATQVSAIAIGTSAAATGSAGGIAIGFNSIASASACTAVGTAAQATNGNACALGAGARATSGDSTAVGTDARASNAFATAIGNNAAASGIGNVAIGNGATASGTAAIAIGNLANTNGFAGILITGFNIALQADYQVILHSGGSPMTINGGATGGSIVLSGNGASLTHDSNILVGVGLASFQANTAQIGGPGTILSTVVLGSGNQRNALLPGMILRCTNAVTSANLAAGSLEIIAPLSTGNVATGRIVFETGSPGASGVTQQAATVQFSILASAGGAGVANTRWDNVTNGAGALAGTLANSPVAGNPTFWLPVSIAGAVKHIPCW